MVPTAHQVASSLKTISVRSSAKFSTYFFAAKPLTAMFEKLQRAHTDDELFPFLAC